jgi:hypothetical protein
MGRRRARQTAQVGAGMTVPELIAELQRYTDTVGGEPRVPIARTQHRNYYVLGVRADRDGDPVIEIAFADGSEPA